MIKILDVAHIREADQYTIKNEPVKSIDLMERAASNCYNWIKKRIHKEQRILIFAGPGNNGGDGLVIARLLHKQNFLVEVYCIGGSGHKSDEYQINEKRYIDLKENKLCVLDENDDLPFINKSDVVIDAIFGSGIKRPITGYIKGIVKHINQSGASVIAIDMPSGLFAEDNSQNNEDGIIRANITLTFEIPKLAFMFADNEIYTGDWYVIPIGLHPDFIERVDSEYIILEKEDIKRIIKKRNRFAHKGSFGHGLLIAGSKGKAGAAMLAAKSAVHSGIGLLTTHVPASVNPILQGYLPSSMTSIDTDDSIVTEIPEIRKYDALAIGPGIGMDEKTISVLKKIIQTYDGPIILDADAINILAENKTWLPFLPAGSIITPHPKEFERITEKVSDDFQRHQLQKDLSAKFNIYIILKGGITSITTPGGKSFFNITGNPGMATGGMGDSLTGILLALMAQGYSSMEACLLGVYIHGLAGDIAASRFGQEYISPEELILHLGKAFKKCYDNKIN